MNFERKPQPRWIRCSFAVAAFTMTLVLAAFIDGLARHYPDEAAQLAQKSLLLAKR